MFYIFKVVKGVNLLKEVPAKNKKPTLYATALLSYLFIDQELREGCAEPAKEGNKRPLDQNKINLLKSENRNYGQMSSAYIKDYMLLVYL